MRCEECNKIIWFWNDWRNKGAIIIDKRHPKYMLTIHWCSEKCYLKYSKRFGYIEKINKKIKEKMGLFNFILKNNRGKQ